MLFKQEQTTNFTIIVKYLRVSLPHLDQCIQMSTNMPINGLVILEIVIKTPEQNKIITIQSKRLRMVSVNNGACISLGERAKTGHVKMVVGSGISL